MSVTIALLVAEFAGQDLQPELPGVSWYVGATQFEQVLIEDAAIAIENFPALQSMQERTEFIRSLEYLPAPHITHVDVVASSE